MNFDRNSDQKSKWQQEYFPKFFKYFPFDEQTCVIKFGSWTYDGFQVNLLNKFRQFFKSFE